MVGEGNARGGGRAPLAPVLARSMRVRTGCMPRKSVRLFANDAAQSTLRRRLFNHASNLADKCGTERADPAASSPDHRLHRPGPGYMVQTSKITAMMKHTFPVVATVITSSRSSSMTIILVWRMACQGATRPKGRGCKRGGHCRALPNCRAAVTNPLTPLPEGVSKVLSRRTDPVSRSH